MKTSRADLQRKRIAALDAEFAHEPDFLILAISKWWTVDEARAQYPAWQKSQSPASQN